MFSSGSAKKKAFTLTETIVAMALIVYVFSGAWLTYATIWTWWHEIAPKIEAQRLVKVALSKIMTGETDTSAGTDSIEGTTYNRRDGIGWASTLLDEDLAVDDDGDGSIDRLIWENNRIDFRLASDSAGDIRSFYVAQEDISGKNCIYYYYMITRNGIVTEETRPIVKMPNSRDIINIDFEFITQYSMLVATVTLQKKLDTATGEYTIALNDYMHLRNI
ncbi:MAG: hypothetical protein PHP46_00100 [Candidatus Omnitrophica bacterium]|nr:hypothetical protein [Candidatus Omnitrophota bacterium]